MPKRKTDLSRKSRRSRKLSSSHEQLEKKRLQARLYYIKCKERIQQGLKSKREDTSRPNRNGVHESKEKRQQRLLKLSQAKAIMRAKETEEERQKRLKIGREQTMRRRLLESQEERSLRLAKERVRMAYIRYMKTKCNLNY